jgi:hypothetical protein
VAGRQYSWTESGLADARRHKVALEEVTQALYAPPGLRLERHIGDLLIVMGMAHSGRVIAVVCDGPDGSGYRILRARALAGPELDEWRRRVG